VKSLGNAAAGAADSVIDAANLVPAAVNAGGYWTGLSKNADAVPYIPTLGSAGIADETSAAYNTGYYGGTAAQVIGTGGLADAGKLAGAGAKAAAKQIGKNIVANAPQKAIAGAAAGAALSPAEEQKRTGRAGTDSIGRDTALGAGMGAILPVKGDMPGRAGRDYLNNFFTHLGADTLQPAFAGPAVIPPTATKDWFGKFVEINAPKSAAEEFGGVQISNLKAGDLQVKLTPGEKGADKTLKDLKNTVNSAGEPLYIRYSDPQYDKDGAVSRSFMSDPELPYGKRLKEKGLSVWPLTNQKITHALDAYSPSPADASSLARNNRNLVRKATDYREFSTNHEAGSSGISVPKSANIYGGDMVKANGRYSKGSDNEPLLQTMRPVKSYALPEMENMERYGETPALRDDSKAMIDAILNKSKVRNGQILPGELSEAIGSLQKRGSISPTQKRAFEGSLQYGELAPKPDYSGFSQFFTDFANGNFNEERYRLTRALAEEKMRLKKLPVK